MTKKEVDKLSCGLYLVHWKNGGASLCAVGIKHNGNRWICCTNWTSDIDKGAPGGGEELWDIVEKVGIIAIA